MEASVEVLTDGSELTEPTIFLTIRRRLQPALHAVQYSRSAAAGGRTSSPYSEKNGLSNDAQSKVSATDGHRYDGSIQQNGYDRTTRAVDYKKDENVDGTILARYNLSGIPTLTSRLVSDQSFKLLKGGAFRSILVPSLISHPMGWDDVDNNENVDATTPTNRNLLADGDTNAIKGACIAGLPSLFLNLLQMGYKVANNLPSSINDVRLTTDKDIGDDDDYCEYSSDEINAVENNKNHNIVASYGDVSIIGPLGIGSLVDSVLDTMFGEFRNRPSLHICEVPSSDSSSSTSVCNWWEVYNDSLVKIWAKSVVSRRQEGTYCEKCTIRRTTDLRSQSKVQNEVPFDGRIADGEDHHHSIVYIVMLRSQQNADNGKKRNKPTAVIGGKSNRRMTLTNRPYSFAILPHGSMPQSSSSKCHKCNNVQPRRHRNTDSLWNALRQLPHEIVSAADNGSRKHHNSLLDFILHIDPPRVETVNVEQGEKGDDEEKDQIETPLSKRHCTNKEHEEPLHKSKIVPQYDILVPAWTVTSNLTDRHFTTVPCRDAVDAGILIRAQHRSRLLNRSLPFAFPWNHQTAEGFEKVQPRNINDDGVDTRETSKALAYGLRSCTSVILHGWDGACENEMGSRHDIDDDDTIMVRPFSFISRIESIRDRCKDHIFSSWAEVDNINDSVSNKMNHAMTVQTLRCKFSGNECMCDECGSASSFAHASGNFDDNEIDLSSCSECETEHHCDSEEAHHHYGNDGINRKCKDNFASDCIPEGFGPDVSTAHLLLLGTGCATPSPLRGSSAYGLLFPTSMQNKGILVLSAIIECGEGTLTSLLRYLPSLDGGNTFESKRLFLQFQLSHVGFIWISHAHLDHYGDLPLLVQAVANAKKNSTHRPQLRGPLFVIAPSKVLNYLELYCNQLNAPSNTNDITHSCKPRMYVGVTHQEYQYSRSSLMLKSQIDSYTLPTPPRYKVDAYYPFHSILNVGVDHCRDSFALMIRLHIPSDGHLNANDTLFQMCFSGDTRPSPQLIQKCASYFRKGPDLLIHEGTFLNDTQGKDDAVRKRHSTTVEALQVAQTMKAKSCILTHFSQRYKHVSTEDACSTSQTSCYPCSWGIALDGMLIALKTHALANLLQLSQCVDAVMLSRSDDS